MKILPLDLTSGEVSLREAVQKAESFFPDSGIDYMIHNAAFERPVSEIFNLDARNLDRCFVIKLCTCESVYL